MCLPIAVRRPKDILSHKEHHGFEYMVIQNGGGFRCGYVKVTKEHPWYGKDYETVECSVHVHGGLSFLSFDEACENGFWLGFDCAHGGDAPDPLLTNIPWYSGGIVRTQQYVEDQCIKLCEQAKEAS